MEAKGIKVTRKKLSEKTGETESTCRRAWMERETLKKEGGLKRKAGSGGHVVAAFRTPAAKKRSIKILETLTAGEHLPEGAKKLKCSPRTVQRHLKAGTWKRPPSADAKGKTPEVQEKRRNFIHRALTPKTHKLRREFRDATHLDHKMCHIYGLNSTHMLQFRMPGSKVPLQPKLRAVYSPKIHCFFWASRFATGVYIHAEEVDFKFKEGSHLQHEKVNSESLARAVKEHVVPSILRTPSRFAVMDCVTVNHSPAVVAAFKDGGIRVCESAGAPHNVEGGYPPYSHFASILDGSLFRPFQSEVAKLYLSQQVEPGRSSLCRFLESIEPLWTSKKYCAMARSAIDNQAAVLRKVLANDGAV